MDGDGRPDYVSELRRSSRLLSVTPVGHRLPCFRGFWDDSPYMVDDWSWNHSGRNGFRHRRYQRRWYLGGVGRGTHIRPGLRVLMCSAIRCGLYTDWHRPGRMGQLSGDLSTPLGDLDGDGWPDYVLMVENGVMAVKSGPTGATLYTLPTPPGYSLIGLGHAGDTDGDGFADVLLGVVPFSSTPQSFASISTIPLGVTLFGAGCPQSIGTTARIGATRPASSAQPFGLTLSQLPVGRPVGLIVGLSATQYLTVTLPWDLTPVGVPGCSLLASY